MACLAMWQGLDPRAKDGKWRSYFMSCIGGKLALSEEAMLKPIEGLIDGFHERQNFGRHVVGW